MNEGEARTKILGMNARNLLYIKPSNTKKATQLADDKLGHMKLLSKNGYPVPKIYQEFYTPEDVEVFDWETLPNSFVIKPAHGFGGEGIIVVFGKRKKGWIRTDGNLVDVDRMRIQCLDILDGSYSMHNLPDVAFIEQKVVTHKAFRKYTYKGTPDVRIICYNLVPVMAMLRVPTAESDGRANIHAGALAIGIEISSGITTHAIYRNHIIHRLPSNPKLKLHGLKVPYWDDILKMSSEIQKLTGLGYMGIDFALDQKDGPMILELNARPGLSIQNANLAPLRERLERVAGLKVNIAEKGVRVGKELFGGEIEREIEEPTGRPVLGIKEMVEIKGAKGVKKEIKAKIDTGAYSSSIDEELAETLGYGGVIKIFKELESPQGLSRKKAIKLKDSLTKKLAKYKKISKVVSVRSAHGQTLRIRIPVTLYIRGKKLKSDMTVSSRDDLRYQMIIGRRDLRSFLVDPSKKD